MKTLDFIKKAIGSKVYITRNGDLIMDAELKGLIYDKTELILIKLTKGGRAYLKDEKTNKYYSVSPKNIRENIEEIM